MTNLQRNYAANDRQPAEGAFLALLASTEPKSLKQLIIDGLNASNALSELCAADKPLPSEEELGEAEQRARATRQALLDWFLFEQGVPGSLASRIGEVI
jgi:hypothetical protein